MLGKFGDLIHMLPVFLHAYKRDKVKPVVMVSEQFASVLDGVSYVTPWVVPMKWPNDIPAARAEAEKHFSNVVVPQWWNDLHESEFDCGVPSTGEATEIWMHGRKFYVMEDIHPNCTLSMWRAAKVEPKYFPESPVVFDRRDAAREEFLCTTAGANGRPVILYNLEGSSCPFPFAAEVLQTLRLLKGTCTLINLAEIKAERIYDLLGLYDRAAGMITVDTATLHLAGTGVIPYVALVNNGWSRAEPKGKCLLKMAYDEVPERMKEIAQQVMKMAVIQRKPIMRNMEDPPSIVKQTHWPVRILDELPKDAEYFNPSLVDRPDGRWLIARKSKHMNSIMAFRLKATRWSGQGVADSDYSPPGRRTLRGPARLLASGPDVAFLLQLHVGADVDGSAPGPVRDRHGLADDPAVRRGVRRQRQPCRRAIPAGKRTGSGSSMRECRT